MPDPFPVDDPKVEEVIATALSEWWEENQPGCYEHGTERPDSDDYSQAKTIAAALLRAGLLTPRPDDEGNGTSGPRAARTGREAGR